MLDDKVYLKNIEHLHPEREEWTGSVTYTLNVLNNQVDVSFT